MARAAIERQITDPPQAPPHPSAPATVVFHAPLTPAAQADAWRRWVDAIDWLATIGATDT